jgi:hypothetical protein
MHRPQVVAWLLLAGAAPGSDCHLSTGPEGVCAAVRLDPGRVDLRTGSTFRIQVSGLDCTGGPDCVDCAQRRRHFRWRSSAPDVATVDSTGVIRAGHSGSAEIRLESDDVASELVASMRVVVGP